MKKLNNRICIYPKDVQVITGKSYRYSRELLMEIRLKLGKSKHHFITIQEFAEYTGIDPAELEDLIY